MIDFNKVPEQPEYNFLNENRHLGKNVCLIGLGGSYAYGTNIETSDIDIRGVATNTKEEILLGQDFEQVCDSTTDTTIYSMNKIIKLLTGCNPNVIELLGLKPEHYLYINDIGQLLLDNRKIFLSKVAAKSFGGYATAQLRRLDNKAGRIGNKHIQAQHIADSMKRALIDAEEYVHKIPEDTFLIYEDAGIIYSDIDLKKYPIDDLLYLNSRITNVRSSYEKLGCRNSKAIEHNKLGKHMMHLMRLFYMGIDILEKGEIITYRQDEHEQLMYIRNNGMLDAEGQPTEEFWRTLTDLEERFHKAEENSPLPDSPDMEKINGLQIRINEFIIQGGLR